MDPTLKLILGLIVIAATVLAILRRVDVRLALLLAALALGTIGGDPAPIVRAFFRTFSSAQYVVPICSAMGFAHVLRFTGCDQHLIHLLVRPLQRVRFLLVPGAVLVGFLVNVPVISQTSTAVAVGTVLVPLLMAAGVSPLTTGAALLLGASLGGELLNPGAPELGTVSTALQVPAGAVVERVLPLVLIQLGVATVLFWGFSARLDGKKTASLPSDGEVRPAEVAAFRVNLLKAAVPLVPLVLLFLTALPQIQVIAVPQEWLAGKDEWKALDPAAAQREAAKAFSIRLIGAAMLVGVVAAALTAPRAVPGVARAFFEGAGYAFTNIVAIIVTAYCFGQGVEQIGLAALLGRLIEAFPAALLPSAGALPLAFGWVSGSGMAATQSLFEKFFVGPSRHLGIDPAHVGAVVSIGAAAGRTMSPVAAVTLMCASMTGTDPLELARRVAVPLLIATAVMVAAAMLMAA
jgi:DcuC family C4-dicarboxylate transporter